jgi:hypothetical protein
VRHLRWYRLWLIKFVVYGLIASRSRRILILSTQKFNSLDFICVQNFRCLAAVVSFSNSRLFHAAVQRVRTCTCIRFDVVAVTVVLQTCPSALFASLHADISEGFKRGVEFSCLQVMPLIIIVKQFVQVYWRTLGPVSWLFSFSSSLFLTFSSLFKRSLLVIETLV